MCNLYGRIATADDLRGCRTLSGYGEASRELRVPSLSTGEIYMAKKATGKSGGGTKAGTKNRSKSRAVATRSAGGGRAQDNVGDAFIKLLQSPLVAELVAVAATAALAALAQEGFGKSGSGKNRAGKAVKQAGKAAAKAVGQRLSTEIDEIKKASKARKA
jgi:hypothetical protein